MNVKPKEKYLSYFDLFTATDAELSEKLLPYNTNIQCFDQADRGNNYSVKRCKA